MLEENEANGRAGERPAFGVRDEGHTTLLTQKQRNKKAKFQARHRGVSAAAPAGTVLEPFKHCGPVKGKTGAALTGRSAQTQASRTPLCQQYTAI